MVLLARWFDRLLQGARHAARDGAAADRPDFTRQRSDDAGPPVRCRRCRAPLEPAARWCIHCGTRLR